MAVSRTTTISLSLSFSRRFHYRILSLRTTLLFFFWNEDESGKHLNFEELSGPYWRRRICPAMCFSHPLAARLAFSWRIMWIGVARQSYIPIDSRRILYEFDTCTQSEKKRKEEVDDECNNFFDRELFGFHSSLAEGKRPTLAIAIFHLPVIYYSAWRHRYTHTQQNGRMTSLFLNLFVVVSSLRPISIAHSLVPLTLFIERQSAVRSPPIFYFSLIYLFIFFVRSGT